MTESAIANRREQRMLRTAEQLTAVSRRLTADRGLSGFTVEELCDEVGISRRTFFNYFPSKEDAVIGADQRDEAARFAENFLARGSRGWPAVVDDLVELIITHFESAGIDATSHAEFIAAMEREPRLFTRFVGITRDRERQAAALIAGREGVADGDPRAEASVSVIANLMRLGAEKYLDPANTEDFAEVLTSALVALRTVLASPTPERHTRDHR